MSGFGWPNHGRFSRQDVTQSLIAQRLVFDWPEPADMVWVHGYLDHVYTVNPIRIRGFDRAGNLLSAIRLNDIRDHDYRSNDHSEDDIFLRERAHGYAIQAEDINGNPIDVFGYKAADIAIRDMVADSHGMLYCAMHPGRYQYTPKSGYSLDYVVNQLNPLYGSDYSTMRTNLADVIPTYFYGYFRKYNRNGERVAFPELHGGLILRIALDASGSIYVGGVPVGVENNVLRKYTSAGELVWSAGITTGAGLPPNGGALINGVFDLKIDDDGAIYCIGFDYLGNFLKKYNASGVLQWTVNFSKFGDSRSLAIHRGFVYTAGSEINAYTKNGNATVYYFNPEYTQTSVQKWSSDGTLIASVRVLDYVFWPTWTQTINLKIESMQFYQNTLHCQSYVYGNEGYSAIFLGLFRLNADLEIFDNIYFYMNVVRGARSPVMIDESGRIYLPRTEVNNLTPLVNSHLVCYDQAGNQLWKDRNFFGIDPSLFPGIVTSYAVYGSLDIELPLGGYASGTLIYQPQSLTVYQDFVPLGRSICFAYSTSTPSVSVPVYRGEFGWQGDRYSGLPGLPVRHSFGLPIWFRDYMGRLQASIYRLYLTGTPDLELKMTSFQIRRNTQSRWLSVAIAPESTATLSDIESRSTGSLVLRRGVRLDNGIEQTEEMLRVPLSSVAVDSGSQSMSISLSGSIAETLLTKTRVLTGISYRASDAGLRRVRCAVDTYLAPGDIADLGGGETLTVGGLVCTVDPQSAVMEISEARP